MPQVRDARDILNAHVHEDRSDVDDAYVCTVVNTLPIEIIENRPHMFPSTFALPPAPDHFGISVFYVGEGIHYVPDPFDEKKQFKQITPPHEMARSLCEDYNSAHIGLDEDAQPGLFWIQGRLTVEDIKARHGKKLAKHMAMQKQWYHNIASMADVDWEKAHNRLAVSDLQRIAARELGIQRDWVEMKMQETIACKFCTMPVPPGALKCPNCKEIVDQVAYDRMIAIEANRSEIANKKSTAKKELSID